MVIYIMRHGQTVWNSKGIIQGRSNNRLSRLGKQQVEKQAFTLKDEHLDLIISSPLMRTIQTANIMNSYHHCKIIKDERIIEVNQGDFTKRKKSSLSENELENYKSRNISFGLEQSDEILMRVKNFVNDVVNSFKQKTILIVTHRAIANVLYYLLLNNKCTLENINDLELFNNAVIQKLII